MLSALLQDVQEDLPGVGCAVTFFLCAVTEEWSRSVGSLAPWISVDFHHLEGFSMQIFTLRAIAPNLCTKDDYGPMSTLFWVLKVFLKRWSCVLLSGTYADVFVVPLLIFVVSGASYLDSLKSNIFCGS